MLITFCRAFVAYKSDRWSGWMLNMKATKSAVNNAEFDDVTGRYKRHDGRDEWKTIQVIPTGVTGETATSMSVHNLQSNTVYKFMVLSRNRLGDGLFSASVTATTKGRSATCLQAEQLVRLHCLLCVQRVISPFGSVFRWAFRWILNSDWDQRPTKKWSRFRWTIRWDQTSDWAIIESKAN